jgi:Ca-activated chloride channel family protein
MRNFTRLSIFLFIISIQSVIAQVTTRLVSGVLNDPDTGEGMAGVNVMVKGTNIGTATDANGYYQIEAPIGSVLVFSFVGYTSREMIVEPLPVSEKDSTGVPIKVFKHSIPDDPDKTLSPYFFVKSDNPSEDKMPLKSTAASVNIAGVIADVQVRQVYVNTGKNVLEAVYIFPGSTRAAVYAMSMTIGNRTLTAKIREKEQARKDYEEARQQGKTATLLEQKRPNIFQMNVANILPGDTIAVDMRYTELLVPVEGTYEFVYPTVVGPRYSETPDDAEHTDEKWVKNPYLHEGEKPDYTFNLSTRLNSGIPIQKITSASHKINVQYNGKEHAMINLDPAEDTGGNRDFILHYRLRGGQVESGVLLHPRQDENFFLLMVEPPEAPTLDQIPAREYIFIVDVSGSMMGFPISVSKDLLRKLISGLRPSDRFNVMLFESSNQMLHQRSVLANEDNIRDAIDVLDRQGGGGGTRLYPALQNALSFKKDEGYSRTFVVITDGFVTIEKEAFNLVRDNLDQANLFAIGIGSSVNRYLIEGLAHAGMGEPFIVTNESEAAIVGKKFKDFVEKPVLTDIKIDYGNFDVYDVEPISIPDVFAERPIIVFGKYRGTPAGNIKLSGYSGIMPYTKMINLNKATSENNEALRYLWARNKIKYLDDYAGYYEGNIGDGYSTRSKPSPTSERIEQVTTLGLKYNLLTQYTSFIAIDSVIRNEKENNLQIKQPLPLPQGVSDNALGMMGTSSGVSLSPDASALEEVVIIGYGEQRKYCLTASISTVRANEFFINATTINHSIQGRVAGVQVNQNAGITGSNATVRIRGNSSIAINNTPLYIVDGVPLDNTDHPLSVNGVDTPDRLADFNSNDIESIEILKDSYATSIYGSKGANGIILITTKKPRVGRQEISLTSSFTIDQVNKLPSLQHAYAQGRPAGGALQWRGGDTQEMFSWGPSLNDLMFDGSAYDYDKNGKLIPISNNGTAMKPYDRYDLFKTGYSVNNNVRVGKATDRMKYVVSAGHVFQNGVIPGADQQKISFRFFYEQRIKKLKLTVSSSASDLQADLIQKGNSASSVIYGLFTTPASFDNGNGYRSGHALSHNSVYSLSDLTQRSFSGGLIDNPYWSIKKNPYHYSVRRITPAFSASYEIRRTLTLNYKVSGDLYVDKQDAGFDIYSAAQPKGAFNNRTEIFNSVNSEFYVQGNKSILNSGLSISSTIGLNNFLSSRSVARIDGEELKKPGSFEKDNAVRLTEYAYQYNNINTRYFGRMNLDYKDILLADLTGSREKTSTLSGKNSRLHAEGVGFAFRFTNLPNYYSELITSGKLYANFSRSRKEAPLFIDPIYFNAVNADVNNPNLFNERYPIENNTSLKPEQSAAIELGGEFRFVNDRITLDGGYFNRSTTHAYVPVFSGNKASLINGGSLSNKGIEIDLKADVVSRVIKWNVCVNFTKSNSMVTSLPAGLDRVALSGFTSLSSSLIAGQPYGVLFGTRYLRNDQGKVVIGADGFPVVDTKMGVVGNPNPDWVMGIQNSFSYKEVAFEFLFDIKKGGDVWNGTKNTLNYYGVSKISSKQRGITNYIFDGVMDDGNTNETPVDFASPSKDVSENRWVRYGKAGVAEDAIEDGSWVRLRNISLSYNFSEVAASKVGLRKLSLSLFAKNVLLITKYSGIDPETNLTGNSNGRGLDYFNSPNIRSYGILLRLGL